MRIVQSFWSCKKKLTQDNFGWLSPQHHLMAWALSCLKLREHYKDLHLYTDLQGKEILIDYLNLPYASVNVCYDSIDYFHPNLWALPKILTYSSQNEPFIHVDGDVFVFKQFNTDLENANLIAQNLEAGTGYYNRLIASVKKSLTFIPEYLAEDLIKPSIGSYNAGIFGGKDLTFIKKYTSEAINLVNQNYKPNGTKVPSINFNILFEQILLHSLCIKEKKEVNTYFSKSFNDFGYSDHLICDFFATPTPLDFLHVIGKKKLEKHTCDALSDSLFKYYPDYFLKIVHLFKNDHIYFDSKIKATLFKPFPEVTTKTLKYSSGAHSTPTTLEISENSSIITTIEENLINHEIFCDNEEILNYKNNLANLKHNWAKIEANTLLDFELISRNYLDYFLAHKTIQQRITLIRHPYLEIIERSFEWPPTVRKKVNSLLLSETNEILGLALIPQMFYKGHKEIPIDELDYNILTLLEEPQSFNEIISELSACFESGRNRENIDLIHEILLIKLKSLFSNRCIFTLEEMVSQK